MGSQRMIKYGLCLAMFLFTTGISAQKQLVLTNEATARYEAGDLMAARSSILEALASPQEKNEPYTWFVKGFIFKEIFKEIEKGNPFSENREIAVDAILRSMQLDTSDKYIVNNKNALKYLALTYYNDAVLLTRSLDETNMEYPLNFYERYKELYAYIDADKVYVSQDVEFFKNMGRACRQLYERSDGENMAYFDQMLEYYNRALAIAPNDFQTNYNLGVNYYNRGVYKIRKIDHNTEIFELIRIQDECIALFKEALPFMLSAHENDPEHGDTLKGLMAIYRSLSDQVQALAYQEELEQLISEGKVTD